MSTMPALAYPVVMEEPQQTQPRLLMGTLIFVMAELAVLLALGLSPLKNFWLMLAALLPALIASLFEPFIGLAALFAFTLFDEQVAVAAARFTSSKFLAIFVAFGFFFRCQRREYSLIPPEPLAKLALAWGFFCMISSMWSVYPKFTFLASITQVLLAGTVLMASQLITTRARLATLLACVTLASAAGAVIMLAFPQLAGAQTATADRASMGTTNANTIARTLTIGIFAGVYVIWVSRSWLLRLVMMGAITATFVGILATRTRAALGGVFLGLVGGSILGLRGSIAQRLLMFGVLAACTFGGFYFVERTGILGAGYLERWGQVGSGVSVRTYIWRTGIAIWWNNPALGVGYHSFMSSYTEEAAQQSRWGVGAERDPHNTWLKALCELGPIGVSLTVAIMIWLAIYAFRIRPGPEANLGFAITAFITSSSLISTLMGLKIIWYMIAVVIALAYTIPRHEAQSAAYPDLSAESPAMPYAYTRY
ncbi:MAG: O-antigen ligase family protein [Phycisphaerales bacterium]|nr:MAG: O-antigen ligase family protein [Phycisphaerales bacterium]